MTNKYYENVRKDLLNLIPEVHRKGVLLEIGAASGNTLVYAKDNNYATSIYGIELCNLNDSNQHNSIIDGFFIGNIEEIEFPFKDRVFDIIIIGDVLEHLVSPDKVLLMLKKYLKKNGQLIVSLPNFRHYSILKKIIFNKTFEYEDSGILDKTHLRFFCKKDMVKLFEKNGYKVSLLKSGIENDREKIKFFNKITLGYFEDLFTVQYYLRVEKNDN